MGCGKEINTLPILTGCPADDEYILVMNAVGGQGAGLYGLRSWPAIRNCLLGPGIITITGDQLNSQNEYYNSSLVDSLVVYYNSLGYLNYGSQFEYITDVDGDVIGIRILIPAVFGSDDEFVIFPNAQWFQTNFQLSNQPGNTAEFLPDGLYVPTGTIESGEF